MCEREGIQCRYRKCHPSDILREDVVVGIQVKQPGCHQIGTVPRTPITSAQANTVLQRLSSMQSSWQPKTHSLRAAVLPGQQVVPRYQQTNTTNVLELQPIKDLI
jgi:hypothetical protein